ncbi:MAG: divalent cation tolerance protein CutA [Candidatus Thalassarchaeaceae archaeon]|nr:divalent cation tolerance protein CutA [Candidatus Thalassarchaeaceae archaeon]
MSAEIYLVQTTLPPSWLEAEVGAFSQLILEAGAACVHHSSTRSTYKWEGKIQSTKEWELQLKVGFKKLADVLSMIQENHPYDIPQIIHYPVETNAQYADWVNSA